MVRIKHRYLLLNFLYPEPTAARSTISTTAVAPGANAVPDVVTFHGPTPDSLTPSLLIRALREQITHLFGDHGAGKTSGNLKRRTYPPPLPLLILALPTTLERPRIIMITKRRLFTQ